MSEVSSNKKIIFTVVENRSIGNVIYAYHAQTKNSNAFYSVMESLAANREFYNEQLNPHEKEIIKLIEEYNDNNLFNIFSKKKSPMEFFQNIDKELVKNRIRPFVEKRLAKIVDLLINTDNQLFFKEKKYTTVHFDDEIVMERTFAEPVFNFEKNTDHSLYYLTIKIDAKELNLLDRKVAILSNDPCIVVIDNKLYRINDIDAKKLLPFFNKNHVTIPKSSEEKYFQVFVLNSLKKYHVKSKGFEVDDIIPKKKAFISVGENLSAAPVLFLNFEYSSHKIRATDKTDVFVDFCKTGSSYKFTRYKRDFGWENNLIKKLQDIGLDNSKREYFMIDQQFANQGLYGYISWFNQYEEQIKELGLISGQQFKNVTYFKGKIRLDFKVSKKNDWFDIFAVVQFDDYQIPFVKLKNHILNSIREYELPNGELAILPLEWFSTYKEIYQFGKVENNSIRIKNFHSPFLQNRIQGIDQRYFNDFNKIVNPENLKLADLPKNLSATLRDYQKTGYKWMMCLQKNLFGGCLADDMGLGKTIQTLAVLQDSKDKTQVKLDARSKINTGNEPSLFDDSMFADQTSVNSPTSLIIAPASLVHNWENEINKFTTDFKVYKFTGTTRTKQQIDFQYYDVVLSTYGVVRNDIDVLQNFYFHYIILDESQVIKNPTSKIYKAILKLQSEHKLVLTGTPIENSLIDLWSQLNFVNRNLLGNLNFYKKEFVTPIEKLESEEMQSKLQLLIQPFILRRNKSEVAKDLPPITEQILYCDMPEDHKLAYDTEKSKIRNLILEKIEEEGLKKSTLIILQGLTKLRQLSNHPVLVNSLYEGESGKFNEIMIYLSSIIAEGHKLLVFSSYVKHLALIEDFLNSNKIKYSLLTGQTTNRKDVIQDFQEDPENKVFLITLKAGGVGLNLTAADYVLIIDPWWNPASEEQAISRAHRIGQDKNVFIYRFITKDTIEEKIQKLKEKKSNLANLFINSNNPFKGINENQLKELFE